MSLTPELEKYVSAKVGSGRYSSASEVVREALRLLVEQYAGSDESPDIGAVQRLDTRLAQIIQEHRGSQRQH